MGYVEELHTREENRKPFDWATAIIVAALLVNIPRLIVYSLKADGVSLDHGVEAFLIAMSGIGTGIVFSGGQLILAHTLPLLEEGQGKNLIKGIWGSMLVFSVVIISPFMVAGIIAQPDLRAVLPDWWQMWLWAITSIAAAEIVAAGVMIAQSLPMKPVHKKGVATHGRGGDIVKIGQGRAPRVHVDRPTAGQLAAPDEQTPVQSLTNKEDRQRSILRFYADNPMAGQRTAQEVLGIPKSTVAKDLSEMEMGGAVDRSEARQVKVTIDPETWCVLAKPDVPMM